MGRDYKDIIEVATLKPLDKARYEELVKNAPGTSVMFYNAKEETVYQALAHPSTVLGSDAYPYTIKETGGPALDWDTPFDAVNGHPRGAGAHARMLRLVREKQIDIPLIDGVSKMSYMIPRFLQDNGVVKHHRRAWRVFDEFLVARLVKWFEGGDLDNIFIVAPHIRLIVVRM